MMTRPSEKSVVGSLEPLLGHHHRMGLGSLNGFLVDLGSRQLSFPMRNVVSISYDGRLHRLFQVLNLKAAEEFKESLRLVEIVVHCNMR